MGSILRHIDNGNPILDIGYTGSIGYIQDGNMVSPLAISETGAQGLTGFSSGNSLLGALNELSSELGASSSYTNDVAMPADVGGWEAGSTFSGKTMKEMFDGLLYPYQYPAFSSFSFIGWSSTIEVGDTNGTDPTATWSTENDSNITADTIDIDDVTNTVNYITGTANDGSQALTASAVTRTSPGSNTWRITGTNSKAIDFTRNYTVNWYWRIYAGTSANTSLAETQIEALVDYNSLASSYVRTYSLSANNYKYICYPTSMGAASSFIDAGTGLAIAMEAPDTVSVTNSFGLSTDYYVYRSTNPLVAAINITIS